MTQVFQVITVFFAGYGAISLLHDLGVMIQ